MSEKLKKKRQRLPRKPGVYLFKDKSGKVIYVGKALSLRQRVASYFRSKQGDEKTAKLVGQIADLEVLTVPSEFDALILEARLVKEHQPKFNVQLKDNKSYLYIGISKEAWPRVFLLRRPELEEGLLDWYGPFVSAGAARRVIRFGRKIFPFRSCRQLPKQTCLYHHLQLCPGVCLYPDKDYQKTIRRLREFLGGRTKRLTAALKKEMAQAAKKLEFEKAQVIKRRLMALAALKQGWRSIPEEKIPAAKALKELEKILVKYGKINLMTLNKIEGYDVSNLGEKIIVGGMVVFVDGEKETKLYRKFKINLKVEGKQRRLRLEKQNDPGSIGQVVWRRLGHPEWLYPQLILVDGGKAQVAAALKEVAAKNKTNQIAVLGLAKREEKMVIPRVEKGKIKGWKILKLTPRSPGLRLLQQIRDESHRFSKKYYETLQRKRFF